MTGIEFRPDGPHSDDYTTDLADAFAESVRVLNHATMTGSGLTYPATAYTVVGALSAGASGLRQLLDQLGAFLDQQDAAGRLGDDRNAHRDPAAALAAAHVHLTNARHAAAALSVALGEAQSALSGLYQTSTSADLLDCRAEVTDLTPDDHPS
jgi:hypothetical protein